MTGTGGISGLFSNTHVARAARREVPEAWERMDELSKAAEPLRDYLKAHGDPHMCVVVTQYGATLKRDEISVPFAKAKCMSDDDFMRALSRNATEDLL